MRFPYLFFFCLTTFFTSLIANEEEFSIDDNLSSVSALEGLPSSMVNGSVCAISGLCVDHNVDFVLPGPETLVFERTYSSSPVACNLGTGWNANHGGWLKIDRTNYEEEDIWSCLIREASGARHFYKRKFEEKNYSSLPFKLVKSKGLTNGSAGEISGRTNCRNKHLVWYPKDKKVVCINGAKNLETFKFNENTKLHVKSEEKKVNGTTYKYKEHFDTFLHINKIECCNSWTKNRYSKVDIEYSMGTKDIDDLKILCKTSDNRTIDYGFFVHRYTKKMTNYLGVGGHKVHGKEEFIQLYLSEVSNTSKPLERYSYTKRQYGDGLLLHKKKLPNDRYLTINYYTHSTNWSGSKAFKLENLGRDCIGDVKVKKNKHRCDRVCSLEAPAGTTKEPIMTHRFLYDFSDKEDENGQLKQSKGYTHVFDAYTHRKTYKYDSHQLLTSISKYTGDYHFDLYSKEKFIWGEKSDRGNLISRYLADKEGNIVFLRNYHYDKAGNILENRLYGCLTGKNKNEILLDSHDSPRSGSEYEVEKCTYSKDGLNLLLSKEDSNGVQTLFVYRPNTDRLIARFLQYNDEIFSREFFEYDENLAVSRTIKDNGCTTVKNDLTGATKRSIVKYTNRTEVPVGLPEEEVHCYWDFKKQKLQQLKRVVSQYSIEGKLEKQEVYDAKDEWRYTKLWEFDAHGNVLREINSIGEEVINSYDENDNLITQYRPLANQKIENSYDFMNRLIKQKEIHPDGKVYENNYTYDYLNNCISKTNFYGHETRMEYDEFSRLVAIYLPEIANENKEFVQPVIKTIYNVADQPISITDAAGLETRTEYNVRGQPTRVNFPDGTFERYIYRLDGKLLYKRSRNGVKNHYVLDHLGRVLKEITASADEETLKVTENIYQNGDLVKTIDPQGLETRFSYDGAGRLTWVVKGERRSKTLYDSLGRPCEVREWYGDAQHEYRASIKEYDLLDRLVEERIEDHVGTVLQLNRYQYDHNGNRTVVQNGEQVTTTIYNLHNNPVEIINAAGEITRATYKYNVLNEHGQRVLQSITTDPLGYQSIDTYDTANQLVRSQRRDPFGVLLSQQDLFYDLNGNRCRAEDALIEKEKVKEKVVTIWKYGTDKQITELIEAVGTAEQKTTHYEYNHLGQLHKLTRPNGAVLFHTYDALGRLKKIYNSDNTLAYVYHYNTLDQLILVEDLVNNQTTTRQYNAMGELCKETFAHGLSIDYSYDSLGRARTLSFPDNSSVEYVYNALDLIETHRMVNDERIYTYLDTKRNLSGQVELAKLPGENGEMNYAYDSMGRCTHISSTAYKQDVPKEGYDAVGNLRQFESQGQTYNFDYDDLNHLSGETGHATHSYRFNSLANRIQKDDEVCRYNALNQLIQKGQETFKYDKNGNLVERLLNERKICYGYDAFDRLISIKEGESEATYQYDPFNRRISKKINAEDEQLFLYISLEEIGVWQAGELKEFRLLVKNVTSSTTAIELDHKLYVPHHDLSGNIVCLTNDKGDVIERYRYTAYGESEVFDAQGKKIEKSLVGNSWQYSSKRRDSESGLIAFGLRYYDVELGRWLTPDPAGDECGPNLYAYVHNSPLVYKDEFGLFGESFSSINEYTSKFKDVFIDIATANYASLEKTYSYFGLGDEQSENYGYERSMFLENNGSEIFSKKEFLFNPTKNYMVGLVNGVLNEKADFFESKNYISDLLNEDVCGTHSASFGRCADGFRYFVARLGMHTETTKKIRRSWKNYFKANPNGYIFWICHSRGVVDTLNALEEFPAELRGRIAILAIAPGGFIVRHLCKSVSHIVSDCDGIPRLDPKGWYKCMDTITKLPGQDYMDHCLNTPMYAEIIKGEFRKFQKECT